MNKLINGNQLSPSTRLEAQRLFVYRFTGDHTPDWVKHARASGKEYPLQFANDADWLANTRFGVKKDGTLSKRVRYCESNPTWPNDPGLRRPNLDIVIE
jgi:hypothetical protein